MSSALALVAALLWGTSDFLGGRASSRVPATLVVVGAATVSASLALAVAVVAPDDADWLAAIGWGAVSGVGTGGGGLALFRGLATGRASVVAPTSAAITAGFPLLVGLALGESPSVSGWLGIGVALPAIVLLAGGERRSGGAGSGAGLALLAGLGFGMHFVALDAAPDGSGLWPLASAKVVALVMVGAVVVARGRGQARIGRLWPTVAAGGVLDVTAAGAYLVATRLGLLSLSAVLTSLYPAPTVALSAIVNGERLHPHHWVGGALAVVAAALIAL